MQEGSGRDGGLRVVNFHRKVGELNFTFAFILLSVAKHGNHLVIKQPRRVTFIFGPFSQSNNLQKNMKGFLSTVK